MRSQVLVMKSLSIIPVLLLTEQSLTAAVTEETCSNSNSDKVGSESSRAL